MNLNDLRMSLKAALDNMWARIDARITAIEQGGGGGGVTSVNGQTGDVFLGISTSGNSQNVLYAAIAAKAKGLKVIGLTGQCQNRLMQYADVCICVPEVDTYKVQELHLPVYHCLCMMLEDKFFGQ